MTCVERRVDGVEPRSAAALGEAHQQVVARHQGALEATVLLRVLVGHVRVELRQGIAELAGLERAHAHEVPVLVARVLEDEGRGIAELRSPSSKVGRGLSEGLIRELFHSRARTFPRRSIFNVL